jgi:ABC-type antimicrobial peptide transport system permease subunit
VGVVANARTDDLSRAPEPEIYLCFWQAQAFSKDLVVRTVGDPRAVMANVQRELHAVDPTAAVENVKTFDQIRDDSLASRTFAMNLLVGFSIVGSVLTLVGPYGILSLSVTSRRRELAIRTALDAERRHIRRLVVGEGLRLIAGGVITGLVIALLLSRVLKRLLSRRPIRRPFSEWVSSLRRSRCSRAGRRHGERVKWIAGGVTVRVSVMDARQPSKPNWHSVIRGRISGTFDGVSTLTSTGTPSVFAQSFSGDGDNTTYGSVHSVTASHTGSLTTVPEP